MVLKVQQHYSDQFHTPQRITRATTCSSHAARHKHEGNLIRSTLARFFAETFWRKLLIIWEFNGQFPSDNVLKWIVVLISEEQWSFKGGIFSYSCGTHIRSKNSKGKGNSCFTYLSSTK